MLSVKYPDLYSLSAVCAKIRSELPQETVEATLRQRDYREAIEKDIKSWCDTNYKLQEPVRVIGLQVEFKKYILLHPTPFFFVSNTFCLPSSLTSSLST